MMRWNKMMNGNRHESDGNEGEKRGEKERAKERGMADGKWPAGPSNQYTENRQTKNSRKISRQLLGFELMD